MEETKELQEKIVARMHKLFEKRIKKLQADGADPFLVGTYQKLRECCTRAGKRLRPVACVMSFRACGGGRTGRGATEGEALDVGVAFELLHNSTLVHDDVMDEDALRRGKPTCWRMFAAEAPQATRERPHGAGPLFADSVAQHAATHAVLAGNILVAEALALALAAGGAPAASILQEAYVVVNHGQVMDVSGRTGEREYLAMSVRKTGWLFRCAILAGARLAGASTACQEALERFAVAAAHAFQICDDIMDVDPAQSKGHELGSDIRQGKRTLLVERALAAAPDAEATVLRRAVDAVGGVPSDEDVLAAIRVIERYSLESVRATARKYVDEAMSSIEFLDGSWPDPTSARFFPAFANFVFERKI